MDLLFIGKKVPEALEAPVKMPDLARNWEGIYAQMHFQPSEIKGF